jgi:predicted anti-sigma-YlaC factor YlaD
MHCSTSRELLSADLDGELAADERILLDRHLHTCAPCRGWAAEAADLHRSLRIRPAPEVPDLTGAILTRLGRPERPAEPARRTGLRWRIGLGLVGLTQVALAGPALVLHPDITDTQMALHHLNAWAVAFAVGLLVVAWQPWRVRGVLPIATTLIAVMAVTVALDLRNDHSIPMPMTAHLLDLAGLVLAWGLARHRRRTGGDDPAGGDGRPARRHRSLSGLPAWLRPGGPQAWARGTSAPAVARHRRRDAA